MHRNPDSETITIGLVSPFPVHLQGGVVRTVLNLQEGLRRCTTFSTVVLANQDTQPADESVSAYPFRSFHWDGRLHTKALAAFLLLFGRDHRRLFSLPGPGAVQLYHLHYFGDYYLHFAASRHPYIITLHGSDVRLDLRHSAFLRAVAMPVLRRARRICFPSKRLMQDFLALFPTLHDRCRVLLNGTALAPAGALVAELPARFVLCTGNLQPVKGQDILIRAFTLMKEKYPDLYLVLIGDGPAREGLTALCARLSLQDRILFLGACSGAEISAALQKCLFYVQPSRSEGGHPLAVMEAMLAGKAVVASGAAGLQEMIEHDAAGLLSAPEDPAGLAEQMERLLQSPELRSRLAERGRQLAHQEYSLEAMSRRYAELYREVLNERR
jgi:glycosyltransferase involved in cell wall biosynthesis